MYHLIALTLKEYYPPFYNRALPWYCRYLNLLQFFPHLIKIGLKITIYFVKYQRLINNGRKKNSFKLFIKRVPFQLPYNSLWVLYDY